MRILQISSARHFGGGERHLRDLASGLNDRGHEVFVALRPTNEWQERLDFLPPERFFHVSIRNSFGMFSAKRIARFVERSEIDLIHAHVARDYLAASVAARVAKRASLVLTRHVMFPLKPFHRFALSNVDAAIGVSPAVTEMLRPIFPAGNVHTIYNGLSIDPPANADLGLEFRSEHAIPADAPLIVTLGELKPLKGQMDFVLAAHEVTKSLPDAHFVVVGVDNSSGRKYRRELKRLVKTLGLAEKFVWLDWFEDTRGLYAATDVFVSPSHSESFGLAILEAMAAARPVVATATEGAKTLIDDKTLLVPVEDPVALGHRILDVLTENETYTGVGDRLRNRAETMFSLKRFVDDHEELFTHLVNRPNGRRG